MPACGSSTSRIPSRRSETGWFIPPQTAKNVGPLPKDLVTQTEDVLVDTRG